MKRRFTILTAALALLTFLAVPMGMWGQAPVNTVLWAEDFSGYSANAAPSGQITNSHNGTTVYDGATLTYSVGNGGGTTKIYSDGGPSGGSGNNLLIAKGNGYFQIADIPTGGADELTVSWLVGGGGTLSISVSTTEASISGSTITTGGASTVTIKFENTHSSKNIRVDNLEITVKTAGSGGDTPTPTTYTVTFDAGDGTFVGNNDFPNTSNTKAAGTYTLPSAERTGYTFDGWVTGNNEPITGSYEVSDDVDFTAAYTQSGGGTTTEHQYNFTGANNFYTDVNLTTHPGSGNGNNVGTIYYGDGGVFVASGTNRYFSSANSGYFMLGKTNAEISLPTFEGYKITQVKVHTSSGVSANVQVSIVSGNNTASAAQQWATNSDFTYNIAEDYQTSTLSLKVTNNYNSQFTSITLVCEQDIPSSDPSISAENVNIAYDAEEGTINYTINNPVEGGSIVASTEAEWLMVDDEAQTDAEGSIYFYCGANSNFYAHSATVTLTYTYGNSKATVTTDVTVTQALWPDANGSTADYPIMVTEAIEAIDEVGTVSNIYVGGIVSNIVEEYSSQYHNITFDMIDEEGNNYFLRAYRCVGTDGVNASEVAADDYVIVKGELKLYNGTNGSIYEFAQGCQLVSLTHPAVPAITLNSYSIEATAAETEGTIVVTYTEIDFTNTPDVVFYESDGTTAATYNHDWIQTEINAANNVYYVIGSNNGAARTAYFKVYGLDTNGEDVYSDLVTVSQAAVPQQYTLEVTSISNAEIIVFDATDPDDTNWDYLFEGIDEVQVLEGTPIALSVSADQGYVLETLMVNNVNHVADIDGGVFIFTMPAENVTITVMAMEDVAPAGGNYVRITSLDQLTDGSKVIIAARYDEDHTNGYYAMPGQTSGKPTGVAFTSETSGNNETLPISITDNEDDYYWTVNVTENGYTFTNADGDMIGYGTSGTNFVTGGTNTEWTIESGTAGNSAMVAEYTGFVIKNKTTNTRAFAFNGSVFGAYATTNMNASGYNFFLDFFVQTEEVEQESYTLDIDGYTDVTEGTNNKGYYLIASPVTVDPATVEGMTEDDFDLYYFDQSEEDEWINYETANGVNPSFGNLVPGKGYLYAKKATNENSIYSFELTGTPYSGNGEIGLDYDENAEFPGFNLIGNPFGNTANLSLPYYRLNQDGSALNTSTESSEVNVMEGVFVQATAATRTATFAPSNTGFKRISQLNVKVTRNRGAVLDNAIIRFDDGATLGKFQLNPNDTKIYITEGNQDYAIVRSANAGEMPVSFKAAENGNYTLSIETENVEVSYLHLIDNMTGADVDLLATPSYSFNARTTDNANRFRLMFNTNGVDENTTTANFAYFNGSSWTISNMGEATLQVIDMMGRVLSTQAISGNADVNLNQAAGVYMLRLVNGENAMVQKVVVR